MRRLFAAVLMLATGTLSDCAAVQDERDNDDYAKSQVAFEDAKKAAIGSVDRVNFFAATSEHTWSSYTWDVISIGSISRRSEAGGRTRDYVARRVFGDRGGHTSVTWADGAACPALIKVAEEIADLPSPQIDLPRMSVDDTPETLDPIGPAPDGTSVEFWGSGRSADGQQWGDVHIVTNGGPIALWRSQLDSGLQACWTAEPIAELTPGRRDNGIY